MAEQEANAHFDGRLLCGCAALQRHGQECAQCLDRSPGTGEAVAHAPRPMTGGRAAIETAAEFVAADLRHHRRPRGPHAGVIGGAEPAQRPQQVAVQTEDGPLGVLASGEAGFGYVSAGHGAAIQQAVSQHVLDGSLQWFAARQAQLGQEDDLPDGGLVLGTVAHVGMHPVPLGPLGVEDALHGAEGQDGLLRGQHLRIIGGTVEEFQQRAVADRWVILLQQPGDRVAMHGFQPALSRSHP